ncbi:esterase [Sphingomonas sp. Leaf407]|uniref:alpha/beta hydrolase n=1 Tax=unclassified Sphingomonas TaxID=196159 RepID=UPI0006F8504A|nr:MULTISPECIES: alpha/beta hydrolase [unclassified Sphingomonas]KQN36977.1 esterase [Sphingomonas sp. Leaf42]KQT30404.1 esterase [Sphingomonas sp. Leaf407]
MTIDRRTILGAAIALPVAARAATVQGGETPTAWPPREHFRLWPGRPPGSPATLPAYAPSMHGRPGTRELWLRGVAEPVVGVFRPARPNGIAVLSIPGGGYGFVSIENEGIDVAKALNPAGITVFALAYRLPGEGWAQRQDVPLQDAQRAMRLIRANAARYGIDPAKLGVCGFSAGGHLAGSVTVAHDDRVYAPLDTADRQSARPAFTGLVYPVTNIGTMSHRGSRDNLAGPNAEDAVYARYDIPARVTTQTPPVFLAHSIDDGTVPVDQSLDMIAACRRAKVPVEAHLFENGGHGWGALHSPADSSRRTWTDSFIRWISERR